MKMPFEKQRIILLITNLGPGGAQRAFSEQALYLSDHYNVSEVVFDKNEAADIYKTGNIQFSLDTIAGKNLPDKLAKLYKRAAKLKELIAQQGAALCISHMDGANWVNILSRTPAKKILVVHGTVLHDTNFKGLLAYVRKKWLIPTLYKKADQVVAVSDGIKKELESSFRLKNVITIPNAFDINAIQQKAAQLLPATWDEIFSVNKVLITSGRLHEQKKQASLLPLFKRLQQQEHRLKLVILGDGPCRDKLLMHAKGLGLKCYHLWDGDMPLTQEYDVFFPGYVSNPFHFLHRSTLFLFPSGWEGFPLALCEAMICGVSVLAADCPTGPREIIAPGTFDATYQLRTIEESDYGFLLPMTDKTEFEDCWYQVITSVLDDAVKRDQLVRNGQRRMLELDYSNVVKKWTSLIQEVLAE